MHPAINTNATALVTGGASGIGLEAARRFRTLGMNVCIVDVDERALSAVRESPGMADVLVESVDVRGEREEKPEGAWTTEQVVDFLFESLNTNDFYILCPDNDVDRATDEKRIAWAAGDIIENRPPLSRWHPDHDAAFRHWLKADE